MYNIPSKTFQRISKSIKSFQPVLSLARSRDINESDTVIIITDILNDLFGYDKYSEITSEFMIRGTYCDLATKIDGKVNLLIEAKAIGIELKEAHTKQAVDYATNQGIDWVILTNGIIWQVYKVLFSKPIEQELVYEFDFLNLNNKKKEDIQMLFPLTKEGFQKSSLEKFHTHKQTLSRFFLGSLILSDTVLNVLRKELRKISPDVKIENQQIYDVLFSEVIKREVLENEKFAEAKKRAFKSADKINKKKGELIVKVALTESGGNNDSVSIDND